VSTSQKTLILREARKKERFGDNFFMILCVFLEGYEWFWVDGSAFFCRWRKPSILMVLPKKKN
jgi:hypothetical protein